MKQNNRPVMDEHFMRSLPLLEKKKKQRRSVIVCTVLAFLVAFATIFQMIRPAIAVVKDEKVLDCTYEVHEHDEDCYQDIVDQEGNVTGKELVCGKADYVIHHHTEECYETVYHEDEQIEEKVLICKLPEIEAHHHDDSCYDEEGNLICEKQELHIHDDTCYAEDHTLICGKTELKEHIHTEECFNGSDEFKEEPDITVLYPAQSFEETVGDLQISAEVPEGTLPADAVMHVEKADPEEIMSAVSSAVEGEILRTEAVEIAFCDNEGNEIEPLQPLSISVISTFESETEIPQIIQVDEQGEVTAVENEIIEKEEGEALVFETEANTVNAIVYTVKKETTVFSDGYNYKISVTYGSDAGVPEESDLIAWEMTEDSEEYQNYIEQTSQTLGIEKPDYVRLFDISIVDQNGNKVEIGVPVDVKVELADVERENLKVVHFGDEPEVLDAAMAPAEEGYELSFETTGFSVYAIVDAPEPVPDGGWNKAATVEQIAQMGMQGFYVKHSSGFYFTKDTYSPASGRTGIRKTKPATSDPDAASGAEKYYFEKVENTENQFRVYCMDETNKKYIRQSGNSLTLTDGLQPDSNSATSTFTIDLFPGSNSTFRMLGKDGYYWNMQGGNNGNGFCAYNEATDTNARIQLEFLIEIDDDPYHLDGKTYGIAYQNNSSTAAALTAEARPVSSGSTQERLLGLDMSIKPDVLSNDGILLEAEDNDIQEFTFRSQGEDYYYITAESDGQTKYLTIRGSSITLENEPDDIYSRIKAIPGTGSNEGKWHFTVNGYSLNYTGSPSDGFNAATGSGRTTWMNLVEKSVIEDNDFMSYSARKVSVSDEENVHDGSQVIIYTRIWNETEKKYEIYAVDHTGSLIHCYDSGGSIKWIGSQINSALWNFTEYKNADGTPSYYYELQNAQYGEYIAPQVTGGQILSDSTIGINLNGRRYGENYTTIIAWDDNNYAYTGLKCENGHIVSCPLSEAQDFYFAIISPVDPENELTTVETINNDDYGITMKMMDFNNENINTPISSRDAVQNPFFGGDTDDAGMVSTNLDAGGYPVTTEVTNNAGHSLSELFTEMAPVNHLLIESVYNESGYFEYNSTSNFAHLNEDGTFTVYDQIGSIADYRTNTSAHGQFMPYNDLTPGEYCNYTNRTTVLQAELDDTNPRKGEKLYNIGTRAQVDYHFAMEMEASFTQTPSGLDAWGHDIIFEFSGDDDFWLYVDGELILDLGGVHSAMSGKVNFRTGEVTTSGRGNSTVYDLFRQHYEQRGEMTSDEIQAKLDELFTTNENGQHVFRDYTKHTMKMFYMERGAGASNLYMRFNLSAVKPGTFILSKKLSGTELANNDLIEFPYQIYYRLDGEDENTMHLLDNTYSVVYKDTAASVKYAQSFTPAQGTVSYDNVFFLKPGQSAEVTLPEDAVDYYVVECGVNPDIYDHVYANGTELTGTDTANLISGTARKEYKIDPAPLEERPEVNYDNHVREGAMRTLDITKKLYDVNGIDLLHYPDDSTEFTFRLYLGNENADADNLPLADVYEYCVRDKDGNYCFWNAQQQKFESLGKTDYAALSKEEKESVTFQTSLNGTVSRIPADHTVEIRNLIVGTKYKIEERDWEIPKGYTRRAADGYTRTDTGHYQESETPYTDTIKAGETPEIEVRNQKGWGLTVEKVWTDKDFMESHDDIFFAVYLNDPPGSESGTLKLYDGKIRRLKTDESELYYYFDDLKYTDPQTDIETTYSFSDFVIKEVKLDNPTVDDDGYVTDYSRITPIDENKSLTIGGKPYGGEYKDDYSYTVTYEVGQTTGQNANIRTDTVTNSRPGIVLYKSDWLGRDGEGNIIHPLEGAVFTLKDEDGEDVAAESYTSDANGLITIAYLNEGTYTLREIATPEGYLVLPSEMMIIIDQDNQISFEGVDSDYYTAVSDSTSGMTAVITIHNRTTEFKAVKQDSSDQSVLQGVHFALYRQVIGVDDVPRKDYLPIPNYEDLVTNEYGILPNISMDLPAGTYYLTETETLEGYDILAEDICFTIGNDGTAVLNGSSGKYRMNEETNQVTGETTFTLIIDNARMQKFSFKKVAVDDPENSKLEGARFNLYRIYEESEELIFQNMVSREEDGLLVYQNQTVYELPQGTYHLVETEAPEGYYRLTEPITITVTENDVICTSSENPNLYNDEDGISYDEEAEEWMMLIANSTGYELPSTGGAGTLGCRLAGGLLILLALALKRRKH